MPSMPRDEDGRGSAGYVGQPPPPPSPPKRIRSGGVESSKKRVVTVKVAFNRPGMVKMTQSTDDCSKTKSVTNE
jgi:hypothetical protein